jgi:hypothetical protein
MVILALIGFANMAVLVRDTLRLQQEGEQTSANVLALDVTGFGESTRFNVRFAFLHDGVWFENSAAVPEEVFAGLHVEDRIAVRYWRKDPSLVRLTADPNPPVLVPIVIWGGASLFFLGAALSDVRRPYQAFWLSRNGAAVRAKVTGTEEVDDEGHWHRAVWIEPNGRTGKTSSHRACKLPPIGGPITILTDPTSKRPSVWEGDI